MIAVDTSFLVYVSRTETSHHKTAKRLLAELSEGRRPWAIPWPCIYEFLRVVTDPRVFKPPTLLAKALEEIDRLLDAPAIKVLGEGPGHRVHLLNMVTAGQAAGDVAHHAHIAALLREHGVREYWTTDKGFLRFPGIAIRNPFAQERVRETRAKYRVRPERRRA